jgi:hypothetical protein
MLQIRQFKAVALNSAKETMADPFYLVVHLGSLLCMVLLSAVPSLSDAEHMRSVRDNCISFTFIAGALATLFGVIRCVTDDIQRGAGDIMMSRPISALTLLGGKLSGLILSQLIMFTSLTIAYLWTSEIGHSSHHLEYGSLFFYLAMVFATPIIGAIRQALFDKPFPFFTSLICPILLAIGLGLRIAFGDINHFDFAGTQAILMIFFAILAYSALLMPFAVKFDTPMVLCSGAILFFLGLFSDYMFNQTLDSNIFSQLIKALIPSWQNYWILDQIGLKGQVSSQYVLHCFIQSALLCGLYLFVSVSLFEKREISGNN